MSPSSKKNFIYSSLNPKLHPKAPTIRVKIKVHQNHLLDAEDSKMGIYSKVIQSGPNQFTCSECGFVTSYKNSCVNHIEAKHMLNSYFCYLCQKNMSSKAALNMHKFRYHKNQ